VPWRKIDVVYQYVVLFFPRVILSSLSMAVIRKLRAVVVDHFFCAVRDVRWHTHLAYAGG
jgi:hypothetical protein